MRTLSDEGLRFVTERHLATLTTLRVDGSPHVTPVGFTAEQTADGQLLRVICSASSRKARHVGTGGRVAVCQVDGRLWLTFEGHAVVRSDEQAVAEAVARYAQRYRQPRENPNRVALEIAVDRILGSPALCAGQAGS
ncbi:pyridoxamine 5'-phosphate oxidase family protein [uncultured Jatrophihabitans sp.]|uniref:pyridoxamine 5'-phosphate oxidase family protein n=1 Tax=uncultured Jatrophihabitans sp. TaxID=1610747 RepID=UPI0035CA86E6